MITEAHDALVQMVHPTVMVWLPDVSEHFTLIF